MTSRAAASVKGAIWKWNGWKLVWFSIVGAPEAPVRPVSCITKSVDKEEWPVVAMSAVQLPLDIISSPHLSFTRSCRTSWKDPDWVISPPNGMQQTPLVHCSDPHFEPKPHIMQAQSV